MTSAWLYLILIGAVALERLGELWLTRRNARRLVERGGYEVGQGHYPWMALLHLGILVCSPLEVLLLGRAFHPILGWTCLALVMLTMFLRYWAITTLGDRWTTRVFVVPGEAPRLGGPYRYLRHPNYLAVIVEVLALPLIHGAWITAIVGSLANAWVLRTRIQTEERALANAASYLEVLGDRPRLVPVGNGRRP